MHICMLWNERKVVNSCAKQYFKGDFIILFFLLKSHHSIGCQEGAGWSCAPERRSFINEGGHWDRIRACTLRFCITYMIIYI